MLYEDDPNSCKRKSMGIVLKRRDNAPILKDVYGGIIDILMKEQNIEKSIEFLNKSLNDIVNEKYPIDKLIITKSLRSNYKNPKQIAHKVLADRITLRDPGNKPKSGDRIGYVYIVNNSKKALQGDKIELPSFIIENKLKIDYTHYITNQIMKPVIQIYGLVLLQMKSFSRKKEKYLDEIHTIKSNFDSQEKIRNKIEDLNYKYVKTLLFDNYINKLTNIKNNQNDIREFFNNA